MSDTPRTDAKWYETAGDGSRGLAIPMIEFAQGMERDLNAVVACLRAWVAGCGDEHFSTKEQCRELLISTGELLRRFDDIHREQL